MSRNTIRASEKALTDVFSDKYLFRIPPYKRPYAWTTEESVELLDDLVTSLGDDDPIEQSPYFLGSIVLIKNSEKPEADVVDGQQRLTTLTILFSVLRDLAEDSKIDAFVRQEGSEYKAREIKTGLPFAIATRSFFRRQSKNQGQLARCHRLTDSLTARPTLYLTRVCTSPSSKSSPLSIESG